MGEILHLVNINCLYFNILYNILYNTLSYGEYYNEKISAWARGLGLRLVNFTPGTWTNADYTTPDMKNYRSSESIYDRVMEVEKRNGLNGHIMLFHLGTDDKRTDKFYQNGMRKMISKLRKEGYVFTGLAEALNR